jgi:hypothetical protein
MPEDTRLITIDGATTEGHRARVVVDLGLPVDDDQDDGPDLTPAPPVFHVWPPPILVGTTVQQRDFPVLEARGRGSRFCRTFSAPGEAILPWTAGRRRLPAGVCEFHSFKDWPSDDGAVSLVTELLDTMPRALLEQPALLPELTAYDPDGFAEDLVEYDGFSLLLTYFHEGEKNFLEAGRGAKEWRRRHRLIYKTIRQHPHGRRVGYMPIQTLTWLNGPAPKGDYDPLAWWAGVGDYAGIDCYAPSITDRPASPALYPDPATFFELPAQLAAGSGRRLFVPELGVIRQGAPADSGEMRGKWIGDCVAYLDQVGAAGVAWWDAPGANNRDFRLDDTASAGSWSAELTRDRRL